MQNRDETGYQRKAERDRYWRCIRAVQQKILYHFAASDLNTLAGMNTNQQPDKLNENTISKTAAPARNECFKEDASRLATVKGRTRGLREEAEVELTVE